MTWGEKVGKVYLFKEIRTILDQAGDKLGLSCTDVPIEISSRMKKTYGAFMFRLVGGQLEPVSFRFSLKLLSGDYPDEIVEHTILHEYAHFYTNVKLNSNHGHDRAFQATCLRLGISPHTHFPGVHQEEVKRGYRIFCSSCDSTVATRRRIDSARDLSKRYLSGCCKAKLKVRRDVF